MNTFGHHSNPAHRVIYAYQIYNLYRKIPNISPGLIDILKHILGRLIFETLKSIIISIKCPYHRQKKLSLSQNYLDFALKSI